MKLNTKIRYGLRSMIELALKKNKEGMFQKDIAKNQDLSEKYLDPIISSLKVAGLIANVAGKKSGYILQRSPSEIKIIDIYRAFEPGPHIIQCICSPFSCDKVEMCTAMKYWGGLNKLIVDYLSNSTLDELIRETEKFKRNIEKKSKKTKK